MLKKLLALAAAFGATTLAVSGSDALPASRASVWSCPRTAVLTALPTLGTVEWRSDYKARKARFSLGLHTFDTVSMGVRLRTGGYSRDRFVNDPGTARPSGSGTAQAACSGSRRPGKTRLASWRVSCAWTFRTQRRAVLEVRTVGSSPRPR